MSRVFYPLLTVSLIMMWLLLSSFLARPVHRRTAVALVAAQGWLLFIRPNRGSGGGACWPKLAAIVLYDIVRSNIAVAWLIRREGTTGAFRAL
jgi:multicomponent K+:H+ antiporter subunit E